MYSRTETVNNPLKSKEKTMVTKKAPKAAAPAAPAKKSLKDLFGKMDKKTKTPELIKVKVRPSLELSEEEEKELVTYVGYSAVFKRVEERYNNQKAEVTQHCFDSWTKFLWDNKCVPKENPKVEAKENGRTVSAIFQVQNRFSLNVAVEEDQEPENAVIDMLVAVGVKEETAMEIVSKELDFTPKRGVKNLSEVMEQEGGEGAVTRFMTMCYTDAENGNSIEVEPLTDADRALLFYNTASTTVANGFYDRLPTYVKSLEELRAVLSVIKPSHVYPSHAKMVVGKTADDELKALKDIAGDMLGKLPA